MGDTAHDLVFLQEAPEGLVNVVVLLLVTRHLQHDKLACPFALSQIQIRNPARRKLADAAVTGQECAAEALRVVCIGAGTPVGLRDALFLSGRGEDRDQLVMLDLGATQYRVGAEFECRARCALGSRCAQEHQRRKSGAARQFP